MNSRAWVSVPLLEWDKVEIKENGDPVWEDNSFIEGVEGIEEAHKEDGYIIFRIGSGSYSFRVSKTSFR